MTLLSYVTLFRLRTIRLINYNFIKYWTTAEFWGYFFERVPTTQRKFFLVLWNFAGFFPENYKISFLIWNVRKRYWHWKCSVRKYNSRGYASNFSFFWQCFRVVFGYWELNLIKSLRDPILKTPAIFENSFGKFEVVTATPNSIMAVKLFCFRSIILRRQIISVTLFLCL